MSGKNQAVTIFGSFVGAATLFFLGRELSNAAKKLPPIPILDSPERVPTAMGAVNNPGNIRNFLDENGNRTVVYEGEIVLPGQELAEFKSFDSMAYGFRAMIEILRNHYNDGDNTIAKEIERYAPPSENDTQAYIDAVTSYMQVSPDLDMSFVFDNSLLVTMLFAMAEHEQGHDFVFNEADIQRGISLV